MICPARATLLTPRRNILMGMGRPPRLGIDIGKVIINGPAHPAGGDTAFFEGDEATMLATPEMDGCVAAIARLASLLDGRVWLVSKCGPRVQDRTLRWLEAHDFYQRTGLPRSHVRFCLTRPEKRIHCEELGLTHFVDDHPEVHEAILGTVDFQYFFGPQAEPVPGYGIHAPTWADAERYIAASIGLELLAAAVAGLGLPEVDDAEGEGHHRPADGGQPELAGHRVRVAIRLQCEVVLVRLVRGAQARVVRLRPGHVHSLRPHDRVPHQRDVHRGRVER